MAVCMLCGQDRILRNSHIVPEFLYSELYNEKNQMAGINGQGNRGWSALQKGIRERLFCESCEQHFNEYCEKPFREQWVNAQPLPDPWTGTDYIHWVNVDYPSFKLFHLSVLFRAGVSTLPTYKLVSLGRHEEKLRQLLLNRKPGEFWEYLIFAHAVVYNKTNRLVPMVSQAQRSKFSGQRCYGFMYGGAEWWICVSSHRNHEMEKYALQPDGSMPFHAVPWNQLPVIQLSSKMLRNSSP